MKKVLLTAALGALVFATGCGNNSNGKDKDNDSKKKQQASEKADEMQRQTPASPSQNDGSYESNQDDSYKTPRASKRAARRGY